MNFLKRKPFSGRPTAHSPKMNKFEQVRGASLKMYLEGGSPHVGKGPGSYASEQVLTGLQWSHPPPPAVIRQTDKHD